MLASPQSVTRCRFSSRPHVLQRRQPLTSTLRQPAVQGHERGRTVTQAEGSKDEPTYNKEFGYSRKDVILIGVGLIGLGYGLYYGLQAFGVEPLTAGNLTQLIIFVGMCVGWIGSYLFRVSTKQMTYVTQLKDYEEAVMKKRLEEMTEEELERMMSEVEDKKRR
eukprot:TRINITY_DN23217_c0_g1_i2.p2 TRINITY_DN23217_c0_g1~~TRINITY_DN23217_c0_g1_i2.p2  ORF type:complete len:164 (-),score=17.41 TRINITY_DN23217_c0_g1_i2:84-575(-)